MPEKISKCINLLRNEIETALAVHNVIEDSVLYSLSVNLHLDQIPFIPQLPPPFFIWGRPDRNHYRIGFGSALEFKANGQNRFVQLQHDFEKLGANWQRDCLTEQPYQASAFCAFAFDEDDPMSEPWQGVANSQFTIPEILLEFLEGHYTLTLSCQSSKLLERQSQIETWLNLTTTLLNALTSQQSARDFDNTLYRAPSEPTNSDWMALVEDAKEAIEQQQLSKVVPARHVHIRATHAFNVTAILKRLAKSYPSCLLLGVSVGNKTLVAATPEQLVALNNGTISCDAMAGTGKGGDDKNQENLQAHSLLQDSKTRHEHKLVVDHLRQRLSQFSDHLSIPDTPSVFPLGHMQHLWTPIKAQCRPGISLFDLAAALHPTPAVAGTPVKQAKQWIAENESFNRGWYSGGIGWIQADGNGELAVLLRTALIDENSADLYAGAGVVSDSDARAELEETELKLSTIIGALCKECVSDDEQHTAQQ